MTTPDILASPLFAMMVQLQRSGFRFRLLVDGSVQVNPVAKLSADVRQLLSTHADELRRVVRLVTDTAIVRRCEVFRAQLAAVPAGTVPSFLLKRDVPYRPGVCFSCGDGLLEPVFGRCGPCRCAWRLVCGLALPTELSLAIDETRVIA